MHSKFSILNRISQTNSQKNKIVHFFCIFAQFEPSCRLEIVQQSFFLPNHKRVSFEYSYKKQLIIYFLLQLPEMQMRSDNVQEIMENQKDQEKLQTFKKAINKRNSNGKNLNAVGQKIEKQAPEEENEQALQEKDSYEAYGWSKEDLRKLFAYYDQLGPKWSIIHKHFPGRDQIAVKNRFYGAIKKMLRRLFKKLNNTPGRKLQQISAQESVHIYLGQKKYQSFKGFLKECFEATNYEISWPKVNVIVQQNKNKVKSLFKISLCSGDGNQDSDLPVEAPQAQNAIQMPNIQPWNSQPSLFPYMQTGAMPMIYGWDNQSQYFNIGNNFMNPYYFHHLYHY